ncbi:MAG TPA: flagellin lysine-N-methylase [Limnobacter sp.]|nr:flagellin lysine-N-methylase [Limnobacter sp.]
MTDHQPLRQYSNEPVLVPHYVSQFKCLGNQCPDTCCSGWNVFVDQSTYAAYKQCGDTSLASAIERHVAPAVQPTITHAATIQRDPASGDCPFLAEGWCNIQSKLGEAWLSDVCANYPRLDVRLGDALFQSMSLSCPEAARLALTEPDAFDFEALPMPMRQSDIRVVPTPWALSHEQMQDVHFFCIQIAKTQGLVLWERLVCIGLLCENLRDLFASNRFDGLNEVLAGIEALVASGQVSELCQAMVGSAEVQASFFRALWRSGGSDQAGAVPNSVRQLVDSAAFCNTSGLQPTPEMLTQHYQRGLQRLTEVAGAEMLLEHAVINDMLQDLFPFSGADPMHNFLKLISRFGLLRWSLAQLCVAKGDQVKLDDLLLCTQKFYRTFRHNPGFATALHESLHKLGWGTMEKTIPIIKPEFV